MKICKRCREKKPDECFHADKRNKTGLQAVCKECDKRRKQEAYAENPEKFRTRRTTWARENPDGAKRIRAGTRLRHGLQYNTGKRQLYQTDEPSRVYYVEGSRRWRADPSNREKIKAQRARRIAVIKATPRLRALASLRRRMLFVLHGKRKAARSMELVGCVPDELHAHLEKLWKPGMSWENYGKWHIDHKRPCASFDLSDHAQQRECFHFTNLQPLWDWENAAKGATETDRPSRVGPSPPNSSDFRNQVFNVMMPRCRASKR